MKRTLVFAATIIGIGLAGLASQLPSRSTVSPLAETSAAHAFGALHPAISPDGASIAFSWQGAIWRMPRSGGVMSRLTADEGFDFAPEWSPDGKRIVYVNAPAGYAGELRLLDSETGTPVPLAKGARVVSPIAYQKFQFHPDGKRVLAVLSGDNRSLGLAWLELESGKIIAVASIPRWSRYALSRDGRWILYTSSMDVDGQQGGNDGPQAQLWKVAADGGDPVRVAKFPSRIHDLCWGADDKTVFLVSDLGGVHYDIWYAPLEDLVRSAQKLTFGQADENRPSISADGRWLAYLDNRESGTSVVVRDLATGIDQTLNIAKQDYRAAVGTLKLRTTDQSKTKPLTARISIQQEKGKFHAPTGALYRILNDSSFFYCDAAAELTLPAGKYRLRAHHGPEYRPQDLEFQISAGQTHDLTVALERWTQPAAKGWYSGENHIHANYGYGEWYNTPRTMLQQCAGEDLRVCNFMVANSDTDGVFDREFFRGGPDPLSTDETLLYWNQEFRSTIWGHMTLINLRQVVEPVFTGFKDTTNPWDIPTNSDVADQTHWQKGLVNYTHVANNVEDPYAGPYAAKSIPIDVALGKIDTLDLNMSYEATVPLYHRLLNCGFHLGGSAGTDTFLNRVFSRLPGADRVYVKLDGPFSYQSWIDGLRAGHSFVTNGPMLEFTVNTNGPGETVKFASNAEVRLVGEIAAQFPLERVEVVQNGKVVVSVPLSGDKLKATLDEKVKVAKSGWIGLRAIGPGHRDHPTSGQYAHTSPIYLEVAGRPTGSRADAEYFIKWIDRHSLEIRVRDRIPNEELRKHVQTQLETARAFYVKMAQEFE